MGFTDDDLNFRDVNHHLRPQYFAVQPFLNSSELLTI